MISGISLDYFKNSPTFNPEDFLKIPNLKELIFFRGRGLIVNPSSVRIMLEAFPHFGSVKN
jgi:hypothetical protein